MMKKDRNQFVDIMRGIAMLLVVLGHTMTGCTVDSQQSLLFNIVWSLQMPLFILISGYVTKYSCTIWNVKGLFKYIKRRTVAYGVLLNPGVEVHHDSSVEDYALIYTNSVVRTYAKVGKRVRIGSNVTVSNEVIVGDDADIQNGETLF